MTRRLNATTLVTLVTLLVSGGITGWAWQQARQNGMMEAHIRFLAKEREAVFAINQRILAYENVLRGGVGLFVAQGEVDRGAWHAYVRTLQVNVNYPGIQGIGYSRWVRPEERETLIRQVRQEGFPAFTIWPPGLRTVYTAIVYLEPFDWRNQRAFGYDMFSQPTRREAMVRARDQGQPAISGRVTLVQETRQGVQKGFLMYLPVYRHGAEPTMLDERRRLLQGFVYSPFRMNDLMAGTLGQALPTIRLEIFDGDGAQPVNLMYDSGSIQGNGSAGLPLFTATRGYLRGGRQWTLRFSSLPMFEATVDTRTPQLLLFGGGLISLLVSAVVAAMMINRTRARLLDRANHELQQEIAERITLEGVLKHAKEMAEAANRAKSTFLAAMSHELRTPLNAVLGYVQILQRDRSLNDRQTRGLATIQQSGQHLLTLINDILDLSKIEAGKLELVMGPVRLRDFLEVIADIAGVRAEKKSLLFRLDLSPALPEAVTADEKRLRQVLLNLLGNAVKFTDRGEVTLRVTAPSGSGDAVCLRFEIVDSGIGIAPDQLARIFLPFEQTGEQTHRAGGTGLGLPISRQLVQLMGGDILVDSVIGRGSRFWFELTLPVVALEQAVREASTTIIGYEGARRSVLVVDDVAANRAVLLDLLGALGFETSEAENGAVALRHAQARAPDLIVTDMVMPELDGQELTRQLRATKALSRIPIVAVSASASPDDQNAARTAGADAFLAKPIDQQELLLEIAALLHLDWRYEAPRLDPETAPESEPHAALCPPPADQLAELHWLARTGNLGELRRQARQLAERGTECRPFAERLERSALEFDTQAALRLIEAHWDGAQRHG